MQRLFAAFAALLFVTNCNKAPDLSLLAGDARAAEQTGTAETVRQAGPMPSLAPIVKQLRPVVVNINSRFKPKRGRMAQRLPPGRPRVNPGPPNNDDEDDG